MAQVMIELTNEELEQINGGWTVIKEIQYNGTTLKTAISPVQGTVYSTDGKNDPGNNPVFLPH